mmetsp:Transcript_58339/g.132114  ORF Transcript_58339/g.132114 Transcript_58339/m.132114 type:complete len:182 (-) Transcript_58339:216-761(-)
MAAAKGIARPFLVVFDLDQCVWLPEMYQLWGGGGPPFKYSTTDNTCADRAGTVVRLLGAIPEIFDEIPEWGGRIAIASRTDEPAWASDLLTKFKSSQGCTLIDLIDDNLIEMYKGSKKGHLTNIKNKSGIDFSHMIFFDDDPANIRDVQSLGVLSVLTPQGVTRKHFEDGLEAFAARDRLV